MRQRIAFLPFAFILVAGVAVAYVRDLPLRTLYGDVNGEPALLYCDVNTGDQCDMSHGCPGISGTICRVSGDYCYCTTNHPACDAVHTADECDATHPCYEGTCVEDWNQCRCMATAGCGNGTLDFGEQCDGAAGSCSPGSACNPGSCTCTGTVPSAVCGDGVKEGAEQCDTSDAGCLSGQHCVGCICSSAVCGDANVQDAWGETCDFASVCSSSLCHSCKCSTCGNGVRDQAEECDMNAPTNTCPTGFFCENCRCEYSRPLAEGTCGNAQIDPGEACDPGIVNIVDPCPGEPWCDMETCLCTDQLEMRFCGDGNADPGEQCGEPTLAGNCLNCVQCRCRTGVGTDPQCGNGRIQRGEQCESTIQAIQNIHVCPSQPAQPRSAYCVWGECACRDITIASSSSSVANRDCTDTDALDTFTEGVTEICVVGQAGGWVCVPHGDTCANTQNVTEYFCSMDTLGQQNYFCANGCQAGRCLTAQASSSTSIHYSPFGAITAADASGITGWVCDRDNFMTPLAIRLWIDSVPSAQQSTADRPSTAAAAQCDGYNNHGFYFPATSALCNGVAHTILVTAGGIGSRGELASTIGPRQLLCTAPASSSSSTASLSYSPFGSVDSANESVITGWACDRDNFATALTVYLWVDSVPTPLTWITANTVSPVGSPYCGGYLSHGFSFQTPASLCDGVQHTVAVTAANIGSRGTDVPIGSYALTCGGSSSSHSSSSGVPSPPTGWFDYATCERMEGWSCDLDAKTQYVTVDIYANGPKGQGTKVLTTTANTDRAAIVGEICGNGPSNHGFNIPLPASLKDGQPHTLYAYARDIVGGAADVLLFMGTEAPYVTPKTVTCAAPVSSSSSSSSSSQSSTHRDCLGPGGTMISVPIDQPCPPLSSSSSSRSSIPQVVHPPVGQFDTATCQSLDGWACDEDNFLTKLTIDIYMDGPVGVGTKVLTTVADDPSSIGILELCGNQPNHGFTVAPPLSLKDGQPHTLYAYARDVGGGMGGGTGVLLWMGPPPYTTPYSIVCTAGGSSSSSAGAVCGNNIKEAGEQCDGIVACLQPNCIPGGTCPHFQCNTSTCLCYVSPSSSSAASSQVSLPISALCGNGVINPPEECDDQNVRAGDGCNAFCQRELGWTCVEIPSMCSTLCGDGIRAGVEQCDDGNLFDGDGCSRNCWIERQTSASSSTGVQTSSMAPALPLCGNGSIEGSEECEVRVRCADGSACQSCRCISTQRCGDGLVEQPEQCDANYPCPNGGFCTISCICTQPSLSSSSSSAGEPPLVGCGNGQMEGTEECEVRVSCNQPGAVCVNCACEYAVAGCGDEMLSDEEQCERNMPCTDGALCENCRCLTEVLPPAEDSEPETSVVAGTVCGNSQLEEGEQCETNAACPRPGDLCIGCQCHNPPEARCGNALLELSEQCDDGNTSSGDGCSDLCQRENLNLIASQPFCSNGLIEQGEQCDDGNTFAGDGCSTTCSFELVSALPEEASPLPTLIPGLWPSFTSTVFRRSGRTAKVSPSMPTFGRTTSAISSAAFRPVAPKVSSSSTAAVATSPVYAGVAPWQYVSAVPYAPPSGPVGSTGPASVALMAAGAAAGFAWSRRRKKSDLP